MSEKRGPATAIPGIVEAVVDGADASGKPLIRWDYERAAVPAIPVWLPTSVDWTACRGVRVLVGFLDGDPDRPVLLGLLDAPPEGARQTLRITSEKEIVLECGSAKIQISADGTVKVLGERILSRAKGIHRIKGGAVQIN